MATHLDVTSNVGPTANAGGPYTAYVGSGITLNATGSSDPGADPLTYTWDVDHDGLYGDAVGATPSLSAAQISNFAAGSTHIIDMRVTDSSGASSTATATLFVAQPVAMSVSDFTTLTYTGTTYPVGNGWAGAINNAGVIGGHSQTYDAGYIQGIDAWIYNNGSFTTIHIGNQNAVNDINSFGVIAGFESPGNSTPRYGFIENGATITTIDLSPYASTTVGGINDAGNFVGSSYLHAGTTYSGYANIGGVYTFLNPFGSTDTYATGINNANDIVGIYGTHAYLDHNGVFTNVDDPLGVQTVADDVNNAGQIVGYYRDASNHWHGYIDTAGVFATIDNPLGVNGTFVSGINDAGQIVGWYADASNINHAFVATLNNPVGQSTNDVLVASPQGSTLVGGAGNDTFVFNFAPPTQSTIADFVHGQDMLQISAAGFDHGLTTGATPTLLTGAHAGVSNAGSNGYFIFDDTDPTGGTLYWDATGGSGADAVALVKLQGVNALLPSDFHIV